MSPRQRIANWLFEILQGRKTTHRRNRRAGPPVAAQIELLEKRLLMTVDLGLADSFAVLGGQAVSNTGPSEIAGNVGTGLASGASGFLPGTLTNGAIHEGDPVASQAILDLITAYNEVAGKAATTVLSGQDLGGLTLPPGVYLFSSSAQLTGTLILDAQGDPNAEFDFQIGSTLVTSVGAKVIMINGGDGCAVYWQVGSSATLGTGTQFSGHILANTSVTLNSGASVDGSVLAINGSVTLDSNAVFITDCLPILENPGNIFITANDPPTAINPGITVTDSGIDTLSSATVTLTNYAADQDVLGFVNDGMTMGNIQIASNVGGVINLTSSGATATTAQWQAALRAVTYTNTSSNPLTETRNFVVTTIDGPDVTTSLSSTISFFVIVTTNLDVVSTSDNLTSLREAILYANSHAGTDGIGFNIGGSGVQTISVTSALPTITGSVFIDGTTQGASPTPLIELNGAGAGAGANGLLITGGGSTVKGLAINRFTGSGIRLQSLGGNTIQGNFIGTNAAGTADLGNGQHGVYNLNTSENLIGGLTAATRNVISGNNQNGVVLQGGINSRNLVVGNYIGTNAAGTAALGNTLNGVQVVHSSGNTIGGTTAGERNVISGNVQNGIHLTGSATTATIIRGNYIGTNAAGTADLGNTLSGVLVVTANNTIGGTVAGAGNVISGNDRFGITIQTTAATGNNVQGNLIGTNAAGTAAIGNSLSGITLYDAGSNTIGGTTAAARNVISGNLHSGVYLSQAGATNNLVRGNYIGTNINGTADLGNTLNGVYFDEKASSNTIGGLAVGARNIISGNNQHGVYLLGFGGVGVGVRNNLVQGNYIGTDVTGTADLGNSLDGVRVQATANTIGGASAAAANLISGNDQDGVRLQGGVNAATIVQGNFIGTKADGTTALANGMNGVQILNSSGNTIGGQSATAGNRIAFNALDGISLSGSGNATSFNSMWRNSIFSNGDLGIDLNSNGLTPNDVNDPDDGPNRLQNFPAFSSVVLTGPNLNITYSVPSLPANSTYPLRIEFYIADANNQEGKTFLGSDTYAAPGAKLATIAAGGAVVGTKIVATATDAIGNTSEFSLFATVT